MGGGNTQAPARVSVCPWRQCQIGTGVYGTQTFPCAGGAAEARGTPSNTNPPSVVLTPSLLSSPTPCTHWDLSPGPRSSNTPQDEALASPAQKIAALGEPLAVSPHQHQPGTQCTPGAGVTLPQSTEFGVPRNIPPGSSSSRGGGIFFVGSAHHVDGGKQVPGKYLPAGACGDAAFTGFTASKPRPQSLQISFHHFSRGLITPLAAGAARRSQVQPLLIAGIYYLNVVFQLLVPVPAPRVPVPPSRTPKPGRPDPPAPGFHALRLL